MSKIYQKMYPGNKNRSKGVLGGFIHNVILSSCNSGSQPYFAKRTGFTLIELLVVVLIIGILAAVALPQYTLAVEKSRAAEPMAVLRSVRDAQEIYYMANGMYAEDLEDLDVKVPSDSKYWNYTWAGVSVAAYRKNTSNDQQWLLAYRVNTAVSGGRAAIACGYDYPSAAAFAERICKALGATSQENGSSSRWILTK